MSKNKNNGAQPVYRLFLGTLLGFAFLCIALNCNKPEDVAQQDIEDRISSVASDDRMMNPGPDPEFVDFEDNKAMVMRAIPLQNQISWERYMYIDKTDTIYANQTAARRLGGYLKRYGFTGIYMYSTSGIVGSSSNYTNFASFLRTLTDSGVLYRGVSSGSASTFRSGGGVTNYNNSRTNASERVNRANLELEWWNNASTWDTWNMTNQSISTGTIPDNDFYEGWYKNLGTTIDTIAARDQVRFSDRILLHCYQNGIPTYSYANARSTGATGGRLDIIAKGARQVGRKIDVYIIISAENTAWGASNTFTGPALNNAYLSGQANPYSYIESQAYNNIFNNMTTFQKQWINLKGFVWFTKRYCYRAVPPL